MPNPSSEPKQPRKQATPTTDWLTRAQVAAELGYRSIFPIRKMEGTKLHPVREARGWLFDPAEVAELKTARMAPRPVRPRRCPKAASPRASSISSTTGASCARSSRSSRSLRASSATSGTSGSSASRTARRNEESAMIESDFARAKEEELRELERRNEQEQKNFETIMSGITAAMAGTKEKQVWRQDTPRGPSTQARTFTNSCNPATVSGMGLAEAIG